MNMRPVAACVLAACLALPAMVPVSGCATELKTDEIIERNASAMGGVEAWRKIQAMVWVGHVESAQMPAQFVLALKRPNKTRFEIRGANQVAVRVYDGVQGWKLRTAQGKPTMQPYSAEELAFAHDEQVIDGPLIDSRAKGVAVAIEGIDTIEGQKAYRLGVTLPSGSYRREWVDTQSFLDVKSERQSRNALDQAHTVTVYYRDYREVEGVRIPFIVESGAGMARAGERLVIDKVTLNPPLQDAMFGKPAMMRGGDAVSVPAAGQGRGVTERPSPKP